MFYPFWPNKFAQVLLRLGQRISWLRKITFCEIKGKLIYNVCSNNKSLSLATSTGLRALEEKSRVLLSLYCYTWQIVSYKCFGTSGWPKHAANHMNSVGRLFLRRYSKGEKYSTTWNLWKSCFTTANMKVDEHSFYETGFGSI